MTHPKRIFRAGVVFTCHRCDHERLWKDDPDHADHREAACEDCGGDLRLVGNGTALVEGAKWYRCLRCHALYMWRRGELVDANNRAGFDEFTEFDWEPEYDG